MHLEVIKKTLNFFVNSTCGLSSSNFHLLVFDSGQSFWIRTVFRNGMKIEVNESVRSFVTEDSDEPASGGKIHTFSQNLFLNLCRFCDQMLVQKPQLVSVRLKTKHELSTCVISNKPFWWNVDCHLNCLWAIADSSRLRWPTGKKSIATKTPRDPDFKCSLPQAIKNGMRSQSATINKPKYAARGPIFIPLRKFFLLKTKIRKFKYYITVSWSISQGLRVNRPFCPFEGQTRLAKIRRR